MTPETKNRPAGDRRRRGPHGQSAPASTTRAGPRSFPSGGLGTVVRKDAAARSAPRPAPAGAAVPGGRGARTASHPSGGGRADQLDLHPGTGSLSCFDRHADRRLAVRYGRTLPQSVSRPCLLRRSPWAVADAILAAGPGDQTGALSTGGLRVLAVAQALPGTRYVEFRPSFVVLIVALMRHPRKCAMPLGRSAVRRRPPWQPCACLPARAHRTRGPSRTARSRPCTS